MTPIDTIETALRAAGKNVKRKGDIITAQCPAHDDGTASLSVGVGTTRDVVVHCHANCKSDDVLAALGIKWSDFGTPATPDAIYPYQDADGKVVYEVVRKPGKQFRQRRPDGAGGWVWNLQGVDRTIYRLPKVLATANAGGTVYVCEGEKDVERLEAEGVTATCNSGGAGKFEHRFAAHFVGADVVIIADRDEPGVEHANDVAKACADHGVPCRTVQAAKGKDAADHFTFGGTIDTFVPLDEPGNEPTVEEWPEPLAIGDEPRPPFPLHIFPDWIADQAQQAAVEMQLTPDLAAQLAITAMSIITARRVEVRINGRWKEWTNTYTVTALPPSAGKSPTVGMMTGALDQWEEELADDAERLIDDRNIDRKHLERLRDDAQKKGEIAEAKSYADQLRDIPPIVAPRLMADDATPEKLVDMLHQQNGRLALVSTEGGLFGMMVGRYSDKANLDVYLGAWSGDTIRVDRVERGSTVVRRPRLTVGLTVQPSVLVEVGRNRELVGRGLTARFMYSRPADTVGNRDKVRDSTYDDAIERRYNDAILAIARRLNERGDDEPLRLEFTPAARKRFLAWQASREALLGEHGPLRHMAEWIAKCDSTVARLAGMLHVADGTDSVEIDVDTVERAIEVGEYWTEHARSTFDMMGASDDLGHARFIHDWLASRDENPASITFRDIQQHAKKRVGSSADLVLAVELLVEYGWLRPEYDGALGNLVGRGKPSPTLAIHPRLLCPPLSPTSPTVTTVSSKEGQNATESGRVGDMGDKSPKGALRSLHSSNERSGGDGQNPGLTSPTSDDGPTDELDDFVMDDLF